MSNMSTTRSRTPENEAKTRDLKISVKILFHYPPTFISFNPKVLTAFPAKIKPTQIPAI